MNSIPLEKMDFAKYTERQQAAASKRQQLAAVQIDQPRNLADVVQGIEDAERERDKVAARLAEIEDEISRAIAGGSFKLTALETEHGKLSVRLQAFDAALLRLAAEREDADRADAIAQMDTIARGLAKQADALEKDANAARDALHTLRAHQADVNAAIRQLHNLERRVTKNKRNPAPVLPSLAAEIDLSGIETRIGAIGAEFSMPIE